MQIEKGFQKRFHSATEEVRGFCGWDYLEALVNTMVERNLQYAVLIATTFETGGRISEVLTLRTDNFDFSQARNFIVITMPVLKKKRGEFRVFPIPKWEPLVPLIVDYIKSIGEGKLFGDISRYKAFLIFQRAGQLVSRKYKFVPNAYIKGTEKPLPSKEIYPHLFRAERASQLAEEYLFDDMALRQFFGWRPKSRTMAERYASLGWRGLALRMLEARKKEVIL